MRFRRILALILIPAMGVIAGCGGAVPDDELGEITYEVPELPEAQQPYEMSLLDPPQRGPVSGPAASPKQ